MEPMTLNENELEVLRIHGPPEEVSLRERAAGRGQNLRLFPCFDAFGDHVELQGASEIEGKPAIRLGGTACGGDIELAIDDLFQVQDSKESVLLSTYFSQHIFQ